MMPRRAPLWFNMSFSERRRRAAYQASQSSEKGFSSRGEKSSREPYGKIACRVLAEMRQAEAGPVIAGVASSAAVLLYYGR
jgi:hypothetical protein